jgi:hypothetical protein
MKTTSTIDWENRSIIKAADEHREMTQITCVCDVWAGKRRSVHIRACIASSRALA